MSTPRLHYPTKRLHLSQLISTQTRKRYHGHATLAKVFLIKLLSLILSMEIIAEIISCKTMLDFAIIYHVLVQWILCLEKKCSGLMFSASDSESGGMYVSFKSWMLSLTMTDRLCWNHLQYHTPYLTSCKSEHYDSMISDFWA